MDFEVERSGVHRFIIRMRWLVFLIVPLLILLSDKSVTKYTEVSIAVFGIFNLLLTYATWNFGRFPYIRILWATVWLFDILLISIVVIQRGGVHSDVYQMFFWVIIQAGFLYSVRGALITSIFSSCIYLFTVFEIHHDVSDVNRAIIRAFYFIITGLLIGYMSKLERQSLVNSLTDFKTKIPNYQYFYRRLDEERTLCRANAKTMVISIFDIDFFKNLNTRYGHLAGDKVLTDLAYLLSLSIRKDDVLARYGGEEFVIVMPNTSEKEGKEALERLRQIVESFAFKIDEHTNVKITISVGMSIYQFPYDTDQNELINQADKALAKAKNSGKNKVVSWDLSLI